MTMNLRQKALITTVVAASLVIAAVLIHGPLGPIFPRTVHRLLHIVGAVLFLGNMMVGALWMILADVSGSPEIFRFSIRGVNLADVVFTGPGVLLLTLNGAVLATDWGGLMHLPWLRQSLLLFGLMGLAWALFLVPMQIRLERLSEALPAFREFHASRAFRRLLVPYFVVGSVAASAGLAVIYLMVSKA
jgi:uncharacterized membrane protein